MTAERPKDRRGLRLVHGGGRARVAGVEIEVATAERSPFPVDAVVIEDDTYSVLGAETAVEAPAEHPIRTWTALHDLVEAQPGTVLVRPGRPLRMLAVIHDLAREPTWTEAWIGAALAAVLREATARKLPSLAVAPLGSVHGRLQPTRFVELLAEALGAAPRAWPRRIWLVASSRDLAALDQRLEQLAYEPST